MCDLSGKVFQLYIKGSMVHRWLESNHLLLLLIPFHLIPTFMLMFDNLLWEPLLYASILLPLLIGSSL